MLLPDKAFQTFVAVLELRSNKHALQASKDDLSAGCALRQVEQKPFLNTDLESQLMVGGSHFKRFEMVKSELLRKVDFSNCFPVFRRFLLKIFLEDKDKIEDWELEATDFETKSCPRQLGSLQNLGIDEPLK